MNRHKSSCGESHAEHTPLGFDESRRLSKPKAFAGRLVTQGSMEMVALSGRKHRPARNSRECTTSGAVQAAAGGADTLRGMVSCSAAVLDTNECESGVLSLAKKKGLLGCAGLCWAPS